MPAQSRVPITITSIATLAVLLLIARTEPDGSVVTAQTGYDIASATPTVPAYPIETTAPTASPAPPPTAAIAPTATAAIAPTATAAIAPTATAAIVPTATAAIVPTATAAIAPTATVPAASPSRPRGDSPTATPAVARCAPGSTVLLEGRGPPRAAILVSFGNRVVGGGSVGADGRYRVPIVVGAERAGVYRISVRVRGSRALLDRTSCQVVPEPPTPTRVGR
jgi:hypothetical protein